MRRTSTFLDLRQVRASKAALEQELKSTAEEMGIEIAHREQIAAQAELRAVEAEERCGKHLVRALVRPRRKWQKQ